MAVPHIFEGNTPAVASQVNDNFDALVEEDAEIRGELNDEVNELKGEIEDILELTSDLNLNNLTDNGYGKLMTHTFCANSGNQDANGYADLVSYTGGVVSFKVDDWATYKPLVLTFTDGETKTLTSIDSIDLSALANGTYTFFVNKNGQTLAKLTESVFIQDSNPATTSGNVWLDTSKTPYKSYVANGSNFDTAFDYVPLPVEVVLTSGSVSSVVNKRYNDRTREILAGWGMPDWSKAVNTNKATPYTIPYDCLFILQGGGASSNFAFISVGSLKVLDPVQYGVGSLILKKGTTITIENVNNAYMTTIVPLSGVN